MGYHESLTEGRNAVLEAFRSGKTVDRLFVLDGCQDGPVKTILREAKKQDTMVQYVKKERLDQLSETKNHQGVIAYCAACEYAEVSDILENAKKKGEALIAEEILKVPNENVRNKAMEYLKELHDGKRDFRF